MEDLLDHASFATVPTLTTARLRLEPLGPEHFEGAWAGVLNPETRRFTGTTETFDEDQIRRWLATRADHHDRADWAILVADRGVNVGEVVLNGLDTANRSMNFRIALNGPAAFGRGYGTEATRVVVDHGLDVVGLHRISLDVFSFNLRAQRVYEKVGFRVEGRQRDTLWLDGIWHDSILMAILDTDPRSPSEARTGS